MKNSGLDPDRPHGYKPRKVTADRLISDPRVRRDFMAKRSGFDARPCDVCGGSKTLVVHNVSAAWPRKFPSRWSDDDVWMNSLPRLAM